MNDMTDAEFLKEEALLALHDKDAEAKQRCDRFKSIATKYEQMARAVLVMYDEWSALQGVNRGEVRTDRMQQYASYLGLFTDKHPYDWTRDGLMKHLGIAEEESK